MLSYRQISNSGDSL